MNLLARKCAIAKQKGAIVFESIELSDKILKIEKKMRRCLSLLSSSLSSSSSSPLLKQTQKMVSVLPIPMHLGQPHAGTDLSPAMLQSSGLFQVLQENDWLAIRSENLCDPSQYSDGNGGRNDIELRDYNARNCSKIGLACEKIDQQVYQHAITDNFLLIIGGDHSIPIGTIPPIFRARKNTGVVWVDAHADINTPETSRSGNIHGMPLGFLLGLVKNVNQLPSFQYFKPCMEPRDLVYIGLRDVDIAEKRMIKELGIRAYSVMIL